MRLFSTTLVCLRNGLFPAKRTEKGFDSRSACGDVLALVPRLYMLRDDVVASRARSLVCFNDDDWSRSRIYSARNALCFGHYSCVVSLHLFWDRIGGGRAATATEACLKLVSGLVTMFS